MAEPISSDGPQSMEEELPPPSSSSFTSEKVARQQHAFRYVTRTTTGYRRGKKGSSSSSESLTPDEYRADMVTFVTDLANANCCIATDGYTRKCNCLSFVADKPVVIDAVADALLVHFNLDGYDKKQMSLANEYRHAERVKDPHHKCSEGPQRNFVLPLYYGTIDGDAETTADLADAMRHSICAACWTTLFDIGKKSLVSIKAVVEGRKGMKHKNEGNVTISDKMTVAYVSLDQQLAFYKLNFGTPFAMKYVRDVAGHTSTREDDLNKVCLPPSTSKRQMWIDWCHEQGYVVKFTCKCKSKIAQVKDWELAEGYHRTQAEADENDRKVAGPICSWRSYLRRWQAKFPELVVRSKGEDTCDICHSLMLQHQHLMKKVMLAREALEEGTFVSTTPDELEAHIKETEKLIEEGKKHIKMHEAQREDYEKYLQQATDDIENKVQWKSMLKFLVIDMGQNASTPMLLGDQPGCIYYMSPLTHYIFGKYVVIYIR